PRRHPLAHCRRRERRSRTPDGRSVGPRPARPVLRCRRPVLLQAVGRADAEGRRAAARRTNTRRHAGACARLTMARYWGFWTRGKLDLLRRYLDAFTTASKNVHERIYLDLFGGQPANRERVTEADLDGS